MKRRDFVKNGIISTAGLAVLPHFLQSCSKFPKLKKGNFNGKVLIVGAGAAGLFAGKLLHDLGIEFEILEASDRVGGRMGKLEGFADYPLDLGAQWLHGKKNIFWKFIRKSDTVITEDDTEITFIFNGEKRNELPKDIQGIFSSGNLPDISFSEHAIQKGFGEEYKFIVENLAGDQGTSGSRLSVYWNNKEEEEWSSGDKDYKFEKTYYDLVSSQFLAPIASKIKVGKQVKFIDYTEETLNCQDQNGDSYPCTHIILTVPITVLKDGDITFNPPLPTEKTAAFQKIGMDAGMKVFLKFSEKFYDDNLVGGSICAAYANEKVGKKGTDNVLLAFIMGEQAETLSNLPDQEIVTALLEELDGIYNGKATANFIDAYVQNWAKHPFIRGAYSYSTIGMGDARKRAAESVSGKIFFAGEAMHLQGHHQTAHGAAESGYFAVAELIG